MLETTLETPLECNIKPVILKEINSERSLEGQMLTVKLQYCDHLMQRVDSFEKKNKKTLMVGRTKSKRRRGQQRMR